jgi:copper chaperone CopZ
MKSLLFNVQNELCGECTLALRHFVGGMDGVASVDVDHSAIAVRFDENAMDEDKLRRITQVSIEVLGYRLKE